MAVGVCGCKVASLGRDVKCGYMCRPDFTFGFYGRLGWRWAVGLGR